MNKFRITTIAAFLLLALSVAVAASNSTQITLGSAATLAGQKLAPGTYNVTWTGQGDNLSVVLKNKNTEVKTTAKATANDAPMSSTSYVTSKDGELTEIRPAGKKSSLTFTNNQNASVKTTPSSAQ
jgi:hypothetical protein